MNTLSNLLFPLTYQQLDLCQASSLASPPPSLTPSPPPPSPFPSHHWTCDLHAFAKATIVYFNYGSAKMNVFVFLCAIVSVAFSGEIVYHGQ